MQVFNGTYADVVSQQTFADKIGRSRALVRKLIKSGVIPIDTNGKISMSEGLKAWQAHRKTDSVPVKSKRSAAKTPLPEEDAEGDLALDDDKRLQKMINDDPIETYNRMRCLETAYKAKLKKLEYQEESKQLYRIEEICKDLSEVFSIIRGELLSIPQRAAGRCEGRDTREIEEIIESEINAALEHIQQSKFAPKKSAGSGRARNPKASSADHRI